MMFDYILGSNESEYVWHPRIVTCPSQAHRSREPLHLARKLSFLLLKKIDNGDQLLV